MPDRIQTCRCGARFVLRKHHKSGKPNPITVYEVEKGNVAILEDGSYRIIGKAEDYDGARHISHFVDCPHAGSFSKGR